MLELLPKGIEIKFEDGHPRQLYFSIRVIYTLQEMYDKPIEKVLNEELLQTEDKYGALVKILKVLLDDDVRRQKKYQGKDIPELSEEYLLDILDDDACRELMLAIIKAFNGGLPKSEGAPQKNVENGQ
jgi:hypothetical protein